MTIRPSTHKTEFTLDLLGDPTSPVPLDKAGDLMLGFCGPMEDVRVRRFKDESVLKLQPLPLPSEGEIFSGALGTDISLVDDCQMLVIPKSELNSLSIGDFGASWALSLEGETSAQTEASAGAQRRYAFPNIVTTALPFVGLEMDPVALDSTASITPKYLPREFTATVASPELNNAGILSWDFPVAAARGRAGYILTGTDQQKQAEIQSQLFIASGLSGATGGALIWLFSSFGGANEKGHRRTPAPSADKKAQRPDSPPEDRHKPRSLPMKILAASALSAVVGCGITWLIKRRSSSPPSKRTTN